MRPIVCIRNQPSAPLGIIEDVLRSQSIEWSYLDTWERGDFPTAAEISGLIVLGGEMNADQLDSYPFLRSVRNLMGEALSEGVPVLGVCLGAQILTRALGAKVAPAPVREIGFLPVKATAPGSSDPVLEPFAPESTVFQFHEDECELPTGCELLFEGTDVSVQAFRAGAAAYGVQFHFEVTEREIESWCDNTPDLERDWGATKREVMEQAKEHLEAQQRAGRQATRRFLSLLR